MATEIVHTIAASGGDYTTLAAWESAQQRDLVAADEIAVAEIDGDISVTFPHLDIDGWTCDSTRYILFRPTTGNKYDYVAGTGSKLVRDGTDNYPLVGRSGVQLIVEDLGFNTGGANQSGGMIGFAMDALTFRRCVWFGSRYMQGMSTSKNTLINCFVVQDTYSDSAGTAPVRDWNCKNVTAVNKAGFGAFGGDIIFHSITASNCVAYNENTKTTYDSYYNPTSVTTCAQNNNGSTALGGSHIDGVVSGDFVDQANDDYHLASGSALIGVATDLSSDFTDDFDGDTRSAWDIGFDEFITGGTTYTLTCNSGSFAVTGSSVDLNAIRKLAANSGAFNVTGTDVELTHQTVESYELTCNPGSFAVTGTNVDLTASRLLTANTGSYTITGANVDLLPVYTLNVNPGLYTVVGSNVDFVKSSMLSAASGEFTLTGSNVTLTAAGDVWTVVSPVSTTWTQQPTDSTPWTVQ